MENLPNSNVHPFVSRQAGTHALIVEGDPAASQLCAELLVRAGFEVQKVDSGIAAVVAARESSPAVIFIGPQLRDVSAREAIGWLRSNPTLQTTPIIAVTANAREDAELAPTGFATTLHKPLSLAAVENALRQVLK